MAPDPVDQLLRRLNRKAKAYEKLLAECNDLLNDDNATKHTVEVQFEKLEFQREGLFDAYEQVIDQYEKVDSQAAEAKLVEIEEARDQHQGQFIESRAVMRNKYTIQQQPAGNNDTATLAAALVAATTATTNATNAANQAIQAATTVPVPKVRTRLPELPPIVFGGHRTVFPRFKQLFDANIGNRTDIDDITKFSLLISYLKDNALKLVEGYDLTAQNYKSAYEALEKEYGKKELIIEDLHRQLLRLMERKPANNDRDYRDIYHEAIATSRALKALGQEEKDIKTTIMTLLTDKMPNVMKRQWYREEAKVVGGAEVQHLIDFVDAELAASSRFNAAGVSGRSDSSGSNSKHQQHEKKHDHNYKSKGTMSALHINNSEKQQRKVFPCFFCSSNEHKSGKCHRNYRQRADCIIKANRCLRCMKQGHEAKACDQVCRNCWGDHHIYLCEGMREKTTKAPPANGSVGSKKKADTHSSVCSLISSLSNQTTGNIILKTFWVHVEGPAGQKKLRVMLDSGAHLSYITAKAVDILGLQKTGTEKQNIGVFGGQVEERLMPKVLPVFRVSWKTTFSVQCLQIPTICDPVPAITLGHWRDEMKRRQLHLAPGVEREKGGKWDGRIDILIGTHDYYNFVRNNSVNLSNSLMAIETTFGWIVHGRLDQQQRTGSSLSLVAVNNEEESPNVMLQRLFDADSFHPLDRAGQEEEDPALDHFKLTMTRLPSGQYQLKLPFKQNCPTVPSNFEIAKKQVISRINKLKKDGLLQKYDEQIQNYIRDGQIEIVPLSEREAPSGEAHYLTHHGVVKPGKNTPLRVVFNASLGKPSLNDCLHTGKNRVPLMTDILMRLRLHRILITGDYRKAFLHVSISPEDRNQLRFLWGQNLDAEEVSLQYLRWKVMVFGVTCSPALLEMTLTHHVQQFAALFPRTVDTMLRNTFVDDVVGGGEERKDVLKFIEEANIIAAQAKMSIQRWTTNDPQLQLEIDAITAGSPNDQKSDIFQLYDSSLKVLGSVLNRGKGEDVFTFQTSALQDFCDSLRHRTSLRTVLSITARVYDVLGLITPVTVIARMLMQKIWKKKLNWDQELPAELKKEFWSWVDELAHLSSVRVPRHYFNGGNRPKTAQLHVCCDSSKDARGAVAYLRSTNSSGKVHVAFVGSKAHVTPTKGSLSIARLELLGAVTAVKLATQIKNAMDPEITLEIVFWTDSMVVLYWINGEWVLWKEWVGNRCRTIQENSKSSQWRHIPGIENPADICSRGMMPSKLTNSDCIWFTGPKFLWLPPNRWPASPRTADVSGREDVSVEAKKVTTVLVAAPIRPPPTVFNEERYSTLETVLRYTAHVQRSFANVVAKKKGQPLKEGELSALDIQRAKLYWFRHVQAIAFKTEKEALERNEPVSRSSHIAIFRPYMSQDGLIRLNARTRLSTDLLMTPDVPILPCKYLGGKEIPHFILLLIRQAHRRVCHAGVTSTLGELRKSCWILRGRQIVISVLKRCVICNIQQRSGYQQPTAPLPALRCSFKPPFAVVGLDLAGPFMVIEHRQRKKSTGRKRGRPTTKSARMNAAKRAEETPQERFKVWILLFTCSTTRAVHFEVVMRIDTEQIIMALERFSSRRGVPVVIYSDNGTQLKLASKIIAELWIAAIQGVLRHAAEEGITWEFIVEGAPWWGGFYERMVGVMKALMRKIIGNALLTVKEFETVLCKVEATINARPITFQYNVHGEPSPLTPNDLLVGQRAAEIPPFTAAAFPTTTRADLVERVKYRESIHQQWKKRWEAEYLQQLAKQFNSRWEVERILIGEVVLIEAENQKRSQWIPGAIEKLIPSADGVVRSVELRTAQGRLRRPIQKLHALELNENSFPTAESDHAQAAEITSEPLVERENSISAVNNHSNQPQLLQPLPARENGPQPSIQQQAQPLFTPPNQEVVEPGPSTGRRIGVSREQRSQQGSVNSPENRPRRGLRERKKKRDNEYIYE